MRRMVLRIVATGMVLVMAVGLVGCGAGIVELALTAQRLYGAWRLYQLIQDGKVVQGVSALLGLNKDWSYRLAWFDDDENETGNESGTYTVDPDALILHVLESTVDPSVVGTDVRVPGHFNGVNSLVLARRVTQGQVTISEEMSFRRQPG